MTNTTIVPIPVERLIDWALACRREGSRYPVESRECDFLWNLAANISEHIPEPLSQEGAPE